MRCETCFLYGFCYGQIVWLEETSMQVWSARVIWDKINESLKSEFRQIVLFIANLCAERSSSASKTSVTFKLCVYHKAERDLFLAFGEERIFMKDQE